MRSSDRSNDFGKGIELVGILSLEPVTTTAYPFATRMFPFTDTPWPIPHMGVFHKVWREAWNSGRTGEIISCNTSIPWGHLFRSWLLHFWSCSPLMHLEKQQGTLTCVVYVLSSVQNIFLNFLTGPLKKISEHGVYHFHLYDFRLKMEKKIKFRRSKIMVSVSPTQ